MTLHAAYVERFPLLEGITAIEDVYTDPELEASFHEFMQWREATPPPVVPTRDTTVPGPHGPVPVRVYGEQAGATRPALVWLHGGAFMMGDLDMPEADRTAREICDRAGAVVVSVDYRLARGGVHYPVPLDDCVAALGWTRDSAAELGIDPARIAIGGASAGATLATGATLRVRDEHDWLPAVLLPVYGMFHAILPSPTDEMPALMADVPDLLRFTPESTAGVTANYLGGPPESADGYAMPILADLTGLCPVRMYDAEYDDLRGSAEIFAAALHEAGVDVAQHVGPGLMHAFMNLPAEIEPVGEIVQLMAATVAATVAAPPVSQETP
jgi:acetyl esterase/lipase